MDRRRSALSAWIVPCLAALVAGWLAVALIAPHDRPARCRDGWASPSIGRPGACSWHGGVVGGGSWTVPGALLAAVAAFSLTVRLTSRPAPPTEKPPASAPPVSVPRPPSGGYVPPRSAQAGEVPCPRCGGAMVVRIARRGRNRGRAFLGCAGFPKCGGTRDHHTGLP